MARLKYKVENFELLEIDTKLGKVTLDISKAICFPQGIVGFSNLHNYCLTEIPENKMPGAFLLQSIEEHKLGFIVLPLADKFYNGENSLLKHEDITETAESYNIKMENLLLLAITTISRVEGKVKITMNLKAPIFFDGTEKIAYQHVFIRNEYPLQFPLN